MYLRYRVPLGITCSIDPYTPIGPDTSVLAGAFILILLGFYPSTYLEKSSCEVGPKKKSAWKNILFEPEKR